MDSNMAFQFEVNRYPPYVEFIVTTHNVKASSGTLDEDESIALALQLIYAAEILLPAGAGHIKKRLCDAREDLLNYEHSPAPPRPDRRALNRPS